MNTDSQHLQQVSEEFQRMVEEFFLVQSRYSAAIKEIQTKLEILDDEFQMRHRRNPIHHMQSRLKTIQSMLEKLKRKNYEVSINSAVKNLPASALSARMCRTCTPLRTCWSAKTTCIWCAWRITSASRNRTATAVCI